MTTQKSDRTRLARELGKVPLFSELNEKELMDVVAAGSETSFEPGNMIMKQGEPGIAFLLILGGKAEVRKNGKTVAELGVGRFFGEMTVVDDKPRTADVVAVEPMTCFGLTEWSFYPVLRRNPGLAVGIIKELVRRLRQLEESIEGQERRSATSERA